MINANSANLSPESILDGLSTSVVCLDHALRITALNAACESVFSVSRRHALGALLRDGLPHFAHLHDRLQQALASGAGFIERELSLQRAGESAITVDCTVTPTLVEGRAGLLLEILPLDRQLRISRDELLMAQHEASRELIRGMAHEIKNPLGGIRGAAQLLEREFPDSQHREYTRVIIREVDRLQGLVNRMLGPNRAPENSQFNIHEVLEHVRQLVQAEAPDTVRFLRDYDPSIPEIFADRGQLIQATLNLVRNAMQAIADNGQIVLRSRTRRQITIGNVRHKLAVQIDIEDSGAGIAPALLEKIFYPMVTTRAEGTGLGLPIAQYLIHSHRGLIECRSQPGCTVFSILLPLESS